MVRRCNACGTVRWRLHGSPDASRACALQHTTDQAWDLVYERFKRAFPATQRTKESLKAKFDSMNQEFRRACRELQRAAKSGAGRDDLLAVKKPATFDVFISMSWWKRPMATPQAMSPAEAATTPWACAAARAPRGQCSHAARNAVRAPD